MMYELPVIIETLEPVVLAERSGAAILTATKEYFSGSVIRGTLAACYLAGKNIAAAEKDADFFRFFLSGETAYLPAYIAEPDSKVSAQPIPRSLQKEKKGARVSDLAAEEPKAGYKALRGFAFLDEKEGKIAPAKVKRGIELHLSRSAENERIAGTSLEGHIYNYEAVSAGQTFIGSIIGSEDALKEFAALAEKGLGFTPDTDKKTLSREVSFGRSRSTQYGLCRLAVGRQPQVRQEFEAGKNAAGNASLYLYASTDFLPQHSLFADAAEAVQESVEEAAAAIGLSAAGLRIGKIFAADGQIDGFVDVWHLARQSSRAILAGSLFELLKADGKEWTAEEEKKIADRLACGCGQRRIDGYGQWKVWLPLKERAWRLASEEEKASRQSGEDTPLPEIPEAVKSAAEKIIKRKIHEWLREKAANDVASIAGIHGNNHLFGRLENIIRAKKSVAESIRNNSSGQRQLKSWRFGGYTLWEILTEEAMNVKDKEKLYPYAEGLAEEKARFAEFAKAVGFDLPKAADSDVRQTYWLWFCRSARINENGRKGGQK